MINQRLPPMNGRATSFGPFRLLAERRMQPEGDKPVRLGNRAFDILAALVEHAGEVVGKDELMARAWPQTFVEEANLKIQVSALRRALGDGQGGNRYVITVPGRGYNFVAPVQREETLRAASAPPAPSATPHNLPFAVTRMIGRDDAVAPLGDPRLVPSAVATVLGLEIRTEDPLAAVVAALRDNRMLLLLDNCEHVIDAAAGLAVAILSGAPGVSILATSREALGVTGEREYRLASLGISQALSRPTAAEAAA